MEKILDWFFWLIGKMLIIIGFCATIFGMAAFDTEVGNLWFFPVLILGGMGLMGVGYLIGKRYAF